MHADGRRAIGVRKGRRKLVRKGMGAEVGVGIGVGMREEVRETWGWCIGRGFSRAGKPGEKLQLKVWEPWWDKKLVFCLKRVD